MVVFAERMLLVQLDALGDTTSVTSSTVLAAVRDAVHKLFGDFGLGSVQSSLQGERRL